MRVTSRPNKRSVIVYDDKCVQKPRPEWFVPDYWLSDGRVRGFAKGRGLAVFLDAPFGPAVLRLFRRGGWAARVSRKRYIYLGVNRSRPFREFHLLADMREKELPVPKPLAAICERFGLFYQGALITQTLVDCSPLADLLTAGLDLATWRSIGQCIERFHDAGVHHADLNARNILVRKGDRKVFLIDFDRGAMTGGHASVGRGNIARLERSLNKLWPADAPLSKDDAWEALLAGYRG